MNEISGFQLLFQNITISLMIGKVAIKTTQRAIEKSEKKLIKDTEERASNKASIEEIQRELQGT